MFMFTQVAKDNLYSVLKRCRELGLFIRFGDFVTVRCASDSTKHSIVCDLHNRRGFNRLVDFINDNLVVMLEIEGDYEDEG